MSLLVVDGKVAALAPANRPAWSVWQDAGVAGMLSLTHSGPRLLKLVDDEAAGCGACGGVLELRQTDHRGAGTFLRCATCGAPPRAAAARAAGGLR